MHIRIRAALVSLLYRAGIQWIRCITIKSSPMKQRLLLAMLLLGSALLAQEKPVFVNDQKLLSVLWQQHAAEYRALCYQAFNIAGLRLNEALKLKKGRLAIITDLDETILDNSYSEARSLKEGTSYTPAGWKQWTDRSAATAVPGAVEFLQLAKKKGVTIFYISNRDTTELQSTMVNLRNLQLPNADLAHMLFLKTTSSKETRRQEVMKKYNVVMLLGDNLNDFTSAFEKGSIEKRFLETDKVRAEWGRKFIVLPNSTYGEWENAFTGYRRDLSRAQKDSVYLQLLKGFMP
jgi:5'-nucleotidase (lipoprotein e(P4) family)